MKGPFVGRRCAWLHRRIARERLNMLMDIESLGVPFASQACHREGSSPFRTLLCARPTLTWRSSS